MMFDEQSGLDEIFAQYRAALPDPEPGPNFMPALWQKIEARHGFWWVFQGLARTAMAGCAAVALVLLALNLTGTPQMLPSYTDALVADHSAERTYYAENVRRPPVTGDDDENDFNF